MIIFQEKVMVCENKVEQWVSRGFHGKMIELPCGSTGIHGEELRCNTCEAKGRPWYICRHGRDTSDWCCELCEMESQ